GDVFEELVDTASYSFLLKHGFIAPCVVFRPPTHLGKDRALDALDAYIRHARGSQAFLFARSVERAHALAKEFSNAGVSAVAIDATTTRRSRAAAMAGMLDGSIRVVANYDTMTEGVDIPGVSAVIMDRAPEHWSTFMQMA